MTATTTNDKASAKTAPRRKKRRRGRRREDLLYYVVEVTEWDWSFMFGVSPRRDMDGPYSDYRHLTLSGKLIHPASVKAHETEVTLMPDPSLNKGERERDEPKSCGSLYLHRGHFQALLPMPLDALSSVLQLAAAGRLRYVVMTGDKLRYGQGLIQTYRLQRMLDADDLPTGEWTGGKFEGNPPESSTTKSQASPSTSTT